MTYRSCISHLCICAALLRPFVVLFIKLKPPHKHAEKKLYYLIFFLQMLRELRCMSIFQLKVRARDAASTSRVSSDANVQITVLRNTAQPEFQRLPYAVEIEETQDVSDRLLTLSASDRDRTVRMAQFCQTLSNAFPVFLHNQVYF